jgi:hypothetical protein
MGKKTASKRRKPTDLIAYCGLYCGDCMGYDQKIADLAHDLRKELRRVHFGTLAPVISQVPVFKVFEDYPQCYDVLGGLMKLRCDKTCRGSGGPPACEIRSCCREKNLDGCWRCESFKTCPKLDILRPHHGDAHIRNLSKIKRQGPTAFVQGKRHWCTGVER